MNRTILGVILAASLAAPQGLTWADPTANPTDVTQDKTDISKDVTDIKTDKTDITADKAKLAQDDQAIKAAKDARDAARKTYTEDVKQYGANDPRTLAAKSAFADSRKAFVAAVHTRNTDRKDLVKDKVDLRKDKHDLRADRRDLHKDAHHPGKPS